MIKVWTDSAEAGLIERNGTRGSVFAYRPDLLPSCAVSVTMPVRLASWNTVAGLAPIFEMNLPEGVLRERLRLAFAKATGTFDDINLLTIVGRSQVGRIRYTGVEDSLDEQVPFQSVDEILASRRDGDLFRYMIDKFAMFSGVSGVQPKVLIRDEAALHSFSASHSRASHSFKGATHIVKFWETTEFPQLAANEYFCLQVAKRCGLSVPPFRLADDGLALVIDRFDIHPDGHYLGFEDFCVLNGLRTSEKYQGSYETTIVKRFGDFAYSSHFSEDQERLFTLIVLNCAIRNGDAHLKNFGIVYDDAVGDARLAPVYDLVTTTVYLPNDRMALTMGGSTIWPTSKKLRQFGEVRLAQRPAQTDRTFERIMDAMSETALEMQRYMEDTPEFRDTGTQILEQWRVGQTGFKM